MLSDISYTFRAFPKPFHRYSLMDRYEVGAFYWKGIRRFLQRLPSHALIVLPAPIRLRPHTGAIRRAVANHGRHDLGTKALVVGVERRCSTGKGIVNNSELLIAAFLTRELSLMLLSGFHWLESNSSPLKRVL